MISETVMTRSRKSKLEFVGFALADCVVELEQESARYLRAVHRTALELAVHNRFGSEIGGFWLMPDQIEQLTRLPDYYPPGEALLVACAVQAYLRAQLEEIDALFQANT
jgi:hypothetical protein